jgi:hypothetical protein
MNYEKIEKLEFQFKKIGELTPKEIGIDPKFCLDKETDEYMKQFKNNESNKINLDNNNIINNKEIIKKEEKNKSNRISKLVQFFESNNNLNIENNNEKKENNIDNNNIESNLNINEDILSTNSEANKSQKSLKYDDNKFNYFELDEDEKYLSTYKLQDFRNNIESYQDKMNIKELLINNIENECFISLPKMPGLSNNFQKEPYIDAINYLKQIDTYKVPLEKLIVIALISVIITDCVDKYWDPIRKDLSPKFLNIDADELMSIYLYITYNMDLPSIYTELDFINYFTGSITKQSMIGYYYTTIEGCLNFIMSAKCKEDFIKINK